MSHGQCDTLGTDRFGYRALDHVAHLGGALFGVLYWMFGRQAWQNARLASAPAVEQAAVETYKNWDQKRK